jgi:hypothetical protein
VPNKAKGVPAHFVSVGPVTAAKALSEGWRLCLRPNILQWSTAPNLNGVLTRHTLDSEQCPVRCTTRLSGAPSTATARIVVGAINTPQPPPFKRSKFSILHIQYKNKRLHYKTQSIDQILSKLQINSIA